MGKQHPRGRSAERPTEIPLRGWWDIFWRVKRETGRDNLSIVAAGVAFHAIFALFPALAAIVSLYGLVADPAEVERQLGLLEGVVPADVHRLIGDQLNALATTSGTALSLSLAFSVLLALWSATRGTNAIIAAANIVFEEEEKRGFFKLTAVSLALTLGGVLFAVTALIFVAVLPAVVGLLDLGGLGRLIISLVRWPILGLLVIVGLGLVYRYAPSRETAKWRWVSWGAVTATLLWLIASILFSLYVANFGSYNETYGSMGAVIVLLAWLYVSAYVVLIGAELDAEMERQTARDTTTGEVRPMGHRGARMADTAAGGQS
ncbi:MAG: YihY/virulence factor BrkB family protein [Rhodospirillales bacterium]|nr:YihY/virulence factor BrkB family protein [Rhodospirillales bacterium]